MKKRLEWKATNISLSLGARLARFLGANSAAGLFLLALLILPLEVTAQTDVNLDV